MDPRLILWARAVKRRHKQAVPLWFFTDAARLPDPLPVIRALPAGLCGVVLRHDAHPQRTMLAQKIARLCRARQLALVIAGDARLAQQFQAGLHLRGGVGARPLGRPGRLLTASAHNATQLRQARRAGADLVFLSPVFPTSSHPGEAVLGLWGWQRLAQQAGRTSPCALGGLTSQTLRMLGPRCVGMGAITAFLKPRTGPD